MSGFVISGYNANCLLRRTLPSKLRVKVHDNLSIHGDGSRNADYNICKIAHTSNICRFKLQPAINVEGTNEVLGLYNIDTGRDQDILIFVNVQIVVDPVKIQIETKCYS